MATPAIDSKGEYETKTQLWKAPSQSILVLLNSHLYYTQNSSSATPRHVHSFFSLSLSPSQVGYCFSKARILMPFQFIFLLYVIFLYFRPLIYTSSSLKNQLALFHIRLQSSSPFELHFLLPFSIGIPGAVYYNPKKTLHPDMF